MELGNPALQEGRTRSLSATSLNASSEVDDGGEHLRLLAETATSEDGRTQPLLQQRTSDGRRQRVLRGLRQALGFVLANWPKLVILGLTIAGIVLVSIHGFSLFGSVLGWFKRHNGWGGWGIFVGVYTAMVSLFFPGIVFIIGSGWIFGFWRGLLAVWIGGAVGQALAFLFARYLLRDWVETFVNSKWRRWKYIDKAIESEGWKLVVLMRLSPIIPYTLLNIAMATTSMPFWSFALVSAIGIVFECAVFVEVGTTADSIASIISGEAGPPRAVQWVMLGLSIFFCVTAAFGVAFVIRRAIRRAEEAERGSSSVLNDLSAEGPERAMLLSTSPSALEREGFVSSISSVGGRSSFFEMKPVATPERPLSRAGASKAKSSPRALVAAAGTPFKPAKDAQRDLELGQGAPMSASRRRSSKAESDEEM